MEWASVAPYFFTSVVAIITAYFTYKRTLKAQSEQTEVDRQGILNDAYDDIVDQLRKEIAHREALHLNDRRKWEEEEARLKKIIRNLTLEVNHLTQKVDHLLLRELEVEQETHRHITDEDRHVDRRSEFRNEEDADWGSDGSV